MGAISMKSKLPLKTSVHQTSSRRPVRIVFSPLTPPSPPTAGGKGEIKEHTDPNTASASIGIPACEAKETRTGVGFPVLCQPCTIGRKYNIYNGTLIIAA